PHCGAEGPLVARPADGPVAGPQGDAVGNLVQPTTHGLATADGAGRAGQRQERGLKRVFGVVGVVQEARKRPAPSPRAATAAARRRPHRAGSGSGQVTGRPSPPSCGGAEVLARLRKDLVQSPADRELSFPGYTASKRIETVTDDKLP